MSDPTLLFATQPYRPLQRLICSDRVVEGALTRDVFPDGERYLRIDNPVRGRAVAVLGGTISDSATLELYDLAGAAVSQGARSLTLLIPYFGYSTMERSARDGEVVTAKLRAHLLSSLPSPSGALRVVMIDLHSPGIPYYFEEHIQPVHLMATELLCTAVRELAGQDDYVLGAVDAGGAKRVQNMANRLGVEAGFVFKRRINGDRIAFTALAADVQGRAVVLCDDMVRTGGSLIQAARAYRAAGATRVSAVATHGVLPADAVDKIRDSGVIDCLVVTDSHPNAVAQRSDLVHVVTIAGLLEQWLDKNPG
ncbi:MAG: ribose-phosphate diphosphokinase [Myxococcota bacterium]